MTPEKRKGTTEMLTGGKILGLAAMAILVFVWYMVGHYFGQTEAFRVWGLALLLYSVGSSFRKSIPVSLGDREIEPLEGWRRAYVLVPTFALGALVSVFPHEVACSINLKGYVCA